MNKALKARIAQEQEEAQVQMLATIERELGVVAPTVKEKTPAVFRGCVISIFEAAEAFGPRNWETALARGIEYAMNLEARLTSIPR